MASIARNVAVPGIVAVTIAAALAVRGWSASDARGSPADRARASYLAALEAQNRFDYAGMMGNLRASWTADPTYLPAIAEVVSFHEYTHLPSALAAEIDSLAGAQADGGVGECIRGLLALLKGFRSSIELPPHASDAARTCVAYRGLRTAIPGRGTERAQVHVARELWRRFPGSRGIRRVASRLAH